MANSLLDMLLNRPSVQERMLSLMDFLSANAPPPPGSSGSGSSVPGTGPTGTTVDPTIPPGGGAEGQIMPQIEGYTPPAFHGRAPEGGTWTAPTTEPVYQTMPGVEFQNAGYGNPSYAYQEWNFPYYGTPDDLVTRRGVTLQPGAMQGLLDAARASDILPGAREVGMIGQGFRSQAAQEWADDNNPYAADYGYSYHPEGLAIDAGFWSQDPELNQALISMGWNQFDRGYEPWHYSYGVTG